MVACRLIVCEKTGHWAAALRRELAWRLTEVRSLPACRELLAASPKSLIAIEVTDANLQTVRDFALEIGERFPSAAFVALLTTNVLDAEELFREAGAVDVIGSVLDLPRIARMALRLVARARQMEIGLPEVIELVLPWPALATPQWTGTAANEP